MGIHFEILRSGSSSWQAVNLFSREAFYKARSYPAALCGLQLRSLECSACDAGIMPAPPGCPKVCAINGCLADVPDPTWDRKRHVYGCLAPCVGMCFRNDSSIQVEVSLVQLFILYWSRFEAAKFLVAPKPAASTTTSSMTGSLFAFCSCRCFWARWMGFIGIQDIALYKSILYVY